MISTLSVLAEGTLKLGLNLPSLVFLAIAGGLCALLIAAAVGVPPKGRARSRSGADGGTTDG